MDIKKTVNNLVNEYNTRNPLKIAEYLGAIIIKYPLVDIRGFYQCTGDADIIYLADNLNEYEERLICAHELGHMILHRDENAVAIKTYTNLNLNKNEIGANKFAVNLLISDEDLKEYMLCDYTVNQIAQISGIPAELVEKRVKDFTNL